MDKDTDIIFDKNTVEFVTVAAEYCGFLERAQGMPRTRFVDTLLKLMPLLYLKASLLPEGDMIYDSPCERFVTEAGYESIRFEAERVMEDKDDYLEVFVEDMAWSDTPIRQSIAETLSDVYQPVKDFVCVYRQGLRETMHDALVACRESFGEYWGQRLLNAMRALHSVKYSTPQAEW